jgi:MFS family permease
LTGRLSDPRWRRVGVLAFTETISWGILYYTFSVLLVPMQEALGAGRAELSTAFSLAIVARALSAPAAGAWVDRHGVRSLMTGGSIFGVLLVLAWSAVTSVTQLTVVFVGIGVVTSAVLYEPAFAAVARWMRDDDRSSAILWITIAAGFASTIFLPIGATLSEALGWREALRWLALVLLVGTVVPHALFLTEPPTERTAGPGTEPSVEDDRAPGAGGSDAAPASDPVATAAAFDAVRHSVPTADALRDRTFWWMAVAFLCGRAPMAAIAAHLPALLVDRGEAATVAALVTGAIGALSVTGRILITVAGRWVTMPRLLGSVYALQGVGLVVMALIPTRASAFFFVVAFGIGFGATTVAKPVMIVERYGPRWYGAIAGYTAAFVTLSEAASPIVMGVARDVTGDYVGVMLGLAALMLFGSFASTRVRPGRATVQA